MFHKQPNAFQCTAEDSAHDVGIYKNARQVLVYMAQTSNIASRDHLRMLEEVEKAGSVLSADTSNVPRAGDSPMSMSALDAPEVELGFQDWAGLVGMPNTAPDIFDFSI